MKKYYTVNCLNQLEYEYCHIYIQIEEYYLLKEGWIPCSDYRDDFNDDYYILDGDGTPGNRKDYCFQFDKIKTKDIFENLKDAKQLAIKKIKELYKKECSKLLLAVSKAVEEVKNYE